jgi:hypothetical protein
MSTHPDSQAAPGGSEPLPVDPAMGDAMRALLGPIARLALAQGVSFAALEEMMKEAFVDEAVKAQPAQAPSRLVSRISVATGLNRREVTRLTRQQRAVRAVRASPASEVFTRWMTDPQWCEGAGEPKPLPRVAPVDGGPSFESLAHAVTRDVHPRSLLDELCRLGIARLDDATDTVRLVRNAFVPSDARAPMLAFLGDNVGDHLMAAVSNVLAPEPPHFEQAVFADELSAESLVEIRRFVLGQWKSLMHSAVPLLEGLIEDDRQQGRAQDQRIRIGLYSYAADAVTSPSTPDQAESNT